MTDLPETDHDEFEDTAALVRELTKPDVARLRECLDVWIKEKTHPADGAAVLIALLETALDHCIELLGTDALRFVELSFRQRPGFRRLLQ